jgi:hypothetical protein
MWLYRGLFSLSAETEIDNRYTLINLNFDIDYKSWKTALLF